MANALYTYRSYNTTMIAVNAYTYSIIISRDYKQSARQQNIATCRVLEDISHTCGCLRSYRCVRITTLQAAHFGLTVLVVLILQ